MILLDEFLCILADLVPMKPEDEVLWFRVGQIFSGVCTIH